MAPRTIALEPKLAVEDYRTALRARLEDGADLEGFREPFAGAHADLMARGLALTSALWDEGWKRHGWPEEVGGLGGGVRHRAVYYDELCRAGFFIPESDNGLETLSPAMLAFAPELARERLPAMLAGHETWGQCFSEPEAGSDMAGLRTRAVADGDGWKVSGQKIWTSNGHLSSQLFTLVRTGAADSRRHGISAVLIDADSEGISRRPLRFANGEEEMCEVFFDEVYVPRNRLVGAENGGWAVAGYLLQFERSMYAAQRQAWLFSRLRALAAEQTVVRDDPRSADVLGHAWARVSALRARTADTIRRLDRGEQVGPEASADKLLLGIADQAVFDAARELLGPAFLLSDAAHGWRTSWWYSRAATVYGGAAEIQRTILADHVLGLPSESGRTKKGS